MQRGDTEEAGASFPRADSGTLELCEELLDSVVTWAVSYKQLVSGQQNAVCG